MFDLIKDVVPALVVSAAVSVGVSVKDQAVSQRLLEDNIIATQNLSEAVTGLKLQLAIFQERYVTREEMEKKIGDKHGS